MPQISLKNEVSEWIKHQHLIKGQHIENCFSPVKTAMGVWVNFIDISLKDWLVACTAQDEWPMNITNILVTVCINVNASSVNGIKHSQALSKTGLKYYAVKAVDQYVKLGYWNKSLTNWPFDEMTIW